MKLKFNVPAALLIFLILYVLLIGIRPLLMPDEARYIEIPREMLADHDFVTPRLNGLRYFEKPIMGYWLIAGSIRVFGENGFAARFVPAVSTGLAALIVLLLGAKMTGRRESGWYATGCFLLMPLVFFVGTTCTLDAIFSLFVTATVSAFYCAVEGYLEKKRMKCVLWLLAAGAAAGCAFLVKGFLAFALPVMAVLPWLVWEYVEELVLKKRLAQGEDAVSDPVRYVKAIFTLPWLPFVAALLVIAPWAVLIHRAQPDFWRYFVVEEHFARFFGGAEAEHPHGPFYFVLTLLWGAGEWFLLSPAIGYGFRKIGIAGKDKSWFRFLVCWFAGPFLFLSASSGKLPTYILPCFPPLAIMVSAGLFRYFEERPEGKGKLFNVPLMVFSAAGVVAVAALLAVFCFDLQNRFGVVVFQKNETWKLFVMFNALILALFGAVAAFTEKNPARKLSFFLVVAFPAFVASYFSVPQHFYDTRCVTEFLTECGEEITPDTLIIAHGSNVHAVCYTFHRNDLVMNVAGELDYGLTYPEAEGREVKNSNVRKFIENYPDKNKRIVMFFPANRYYDHKAKNLLPPAILEKKSIPSDPETRKANGMVFARFQ
jgi:4-amino-4-deoxy-L-arabinose transferase